MGNLNELPLFILKSTILEKNGFKKNKKWHKKNGKPDVRNLKNVGKPLFESIKKPMKTNSKTK